MADLHCLSFSLYRLRLAVNVIVGIASIAKNVCRVSNRSQENPCRNGKDRGVFATKTHTIGLH